MPSSDNFYCLFQSHLLVDVLGLPAASPSLKALVDCIGIRLLNDLLLQPPTAYKAELTYVEVREDGSVALHPMYINLLMVLYWWCHSLILDNCMPPTPIAPIESIFSASSRMFCGRLEKYPSSASW